MPTLEKNAEHITYGMPLGTTDKSATAFSRQPSSSYQDHIRALGLAAWKKLKEDSTEAPGSEIAQSLDEDLVSFIERINKKPSEKVRGT